jgi:hypothetical protein
MRITGAFLLLGCFALRPVVWNAIGFLMVGFGPICLLVAERRRQSTAPAALRSDCVDPARWPPLQIEENAQSTQFVRVSSSRIDPLPPPPSLLVPSCRGQLSLREMSSLTDDQNEPKTCSL